MAERRARVTVVGGGLGGALAAICLARAGFEVEVYERHGDLRREPVAGPSMNLGLSRRGIDALARVGLDRRVLAYGIPMLGRVVHRRAGGTAHQPYGRDRHQVIHAVKRADINARLLDALDELGVGLHFHHRCVDLDRERAAATFERPGGGRVAAEADFVVGADGVHSLVRRRMQRGERADYAQEYLDWGWKELTVPAAEGGAWRLERNAFHLWPRGRGMVFAHPNLDGTFTCSLVLPFDGPGGFAALAGEAEVRAFFAREYPDLAALVPDLVEQIRSRPVIDLVSVRTRPWHFRDRVVLIGDAAHAVVPFYAQGMNAAFEDSRLLVSALSEGGDRAAAFAAFERGRKPDTDALAELSKANFVELRDRVRSPWLRARRRLDGILGRVLGAAWMPLHARITNTLVPYAEAVRADRRQQVVLAAALLAAGVAAWAWWFARGTG